MPCSPERAPPTETQKWMKELYQHAAPHVPHMGMMEGFTVVPTQLEVKFRRWDDILKWQSPDQKTMPLTTAFFVASVAS